MNRIYRGTDGEFGLVIRRGTCQDMDDLTTICHLCYPDLLRWRGPRFHTRKWWQALLDAEYCELWVCLSHGQVIGFFAFVLDRAQFEEALSRHRPGLLAAFYMFATCPRLFIRKALQELKLKGTKSMLKFVRSPSNGDERQTSEGLRRLFDDPVPWVGPLAVVPSMQRRSVATEMIQFCFQEAIELGYKEIRAYFVRSNTRSIGLFEKRGFVMTHEGQCNVFYRKTLTGELRSRAKSI
ncbi:MAG: GNAT family N-acetyltransferase [Planctomycetota bacterium]